MDCEDLIKSVDKFIKAYDTNKDGHIDLGDKEGKAVLKKMGEKCDTN